ncbi:cutinase family protein [Luteipulveratus halotolerans]|uniref:cutinase family protein n=1 Tax=Luteipulveratus halotolerans TaxID=1631356 RepID=UPI0018D1974D|nr:cutinase family protein [Luteipulveratus halotolerans]
MTTRSATVVRAPVLVITVRGSTEPASGSRLLTPIARAVARRCPGEVEVHSLAYPATFERFDATYPASIDLGESPGIGVRNLVSVLNGQAGARPELRIVLLGWSQGAQVITDALIAPHLRCAGRHAPVLDHRASELIEAIALFGNPTFTAGMPYNAGEFAPGISGVTPRTGDPLGPYAGRMRDYCAAGDISAQNAPGSDVEGHVAYFHNGMPDQAETVAFLPMCGVEA